VLVELFGMTNAPFAIWIDEDGTIVRPAEVAFAPRGDQDEGQDQSALIAQLPERQRKIIEAMTANMSDPGRYAAAVRDWAVNGAKSRYVLSEAEVIERSRPRPPEFGLAAAHFELGQHLHRAGEHAAAIPHWREAHRLAPDNWTYKRNAWDFEDPMRQGHTDAYEGSWYEDVKQLGAENYYPPLIP
jgi:tetratricopeptide (TPR) repeat protein